MLTAASSTVIDFLLKSSAREALGAGSDLLRFVALYYATVKGLSFVTHTVATDCALPVHRTGAVDDLVGPGRLLHQS
jgi:hypothetical protein